MGFAARAAALLAAPAGAWAAPLGTAALVMLDELTLRLLPHAAFPTNVWPLAVLPACAVTVGALLASVGRWLRGKPPVRAGTSFVAGAAAMSALRLAAGVGLAIFGADFDATELLAGVAVALTAWGGVRLARDGNLRAALAMLALAQALYLMPVWGRHGGGWGQSHGHLFWDHGNSHLH